MLDRALNMNSLSVSAVNSQWGHWVKCQQLFSARLESLYQWNWYLALCSPDNASSVGSSLWWLSILMLSLQLVPAWLEVRAMQACQERRCLSPLCVKTLFALFFFFSTSSTSSAVSPLSLSQSNYWNSCINCQHLPTWPCQWGGNSALSWFSLWSNAPAPSFSTMERRCVMVYIHEHISPLLWLVLPLILSLFVCVSLGTSGSFFLLFDVFFLLY